MVLSLRRLVGMRLVFVVALLASVFMTLSFSQVVNAALAGTWVNSSTLYVGSSTNTFSGPSSETLQDSLGRRYDYIVFNKPGGLEKVIFPKGTNLNTATSAQHTLLSGGRYNPSSNQTVTFAKTLAQTTSGTPTTGTPSGTTGDTTATSKETCNLPNVGWIVCPVSLLLAGVTDSAYALVEKLLVFEVYKNPLDTSSNNPVYTIWSNIRNLANIAFIFAFFAIIFSQATSIGLASYGIKKMLPRLIVAAILVNLSYFICVFAVDISNIIGAGIDGLIRAVPLGGGGGTSSDPATATGTWTAILTTLLAGGLVVAAGGPIAVLAAALPFLVIALFAIVTALVVLIARQAILIMLIIIAPLAFVAYILPNTEDSFNKWKKLFVSLLVFYPLVAVVFAGSSVAASVLRITANGGGFDDQLIKLMSLAVQAFPLFALPFLLKFSGGVLGRVGGMINNPNRGPFDGLRKRAEMKRDTVQAGARKRAIEKPRPNYTGRTGAFRTKLANSSLNAFSTRRAAQGAVDRERELENAKQGEARAATSYYAGRVGEDTNYANRMAGGNNLLGRQANPGDMSRVVGRANEAIIRLNNEEISAHNLNLNRNGATLAANGIGLNTAGQFIDLKTNLVLDDTELRARASKIGLGSAVTAEGRFDIETEAALKYATQNRLPDTVNGAKSLASTLAATGNLTASTATNLVNNVQVSPEEKSFLTAHINAEAGKAGLKHLSYNTVEVRTDPVTREQRAEFVLGGQFGGVPNVVDRIMQNGMHTVTKEMYADKDFGREFAKQIQQLSIQSPDTYDTELIKMDERKMKFLAEAQQKAIDEGVIVGPFVAPTYEQLRTRREKAIEKYGIVD